MALKSLAAALLAATALTGCATLAPTYERPGLPVPGAFADPAAAPATGPSGADLAWRDVFRDARLQGVVTLALAQNRDLRVAVADIERARAAYGVQRAELFPAIDATGAGERARTPAALTGTGRAETTAQYRVTAGVAAYELDLFGRVRSLSDAALQSYLATEEDRRAVEISLVAETANAWLALAADQELLAITEETLTSRDAALNLIQKRFDAGAASELDLRQAQTLSEQARSDLAVARARVDQDRNALRLVTGAEVPADLLPPPRLAEAAGALADVPAGLASEVLVRRPDVAAAERRLRAQNANIGAARAAFFPRISLTAAAGTLSPALGGLFNGGSGAWSFAPAVSLPIFSGGANVANLRGAEASRDAAIAQYERAVQTGFREVSDALAVRATADERVQAQVRLRDAAATAERLTQARYDQGVDNYLALLDAQRTNYAARRTLLLAELDRATNRVELYRALGGGAETAPTAPPQPPAQAAR